MVWLPMDCTSVALTQPPAPARHEEPRLAHEPGLCFWELTQPSRLKPFGPRARPARRGPLRKDWERGCGRHVCLIAPRRIGLGLRAEPPLGPSIQQHNSRRARSRPWPLQPTHRNDTKHDLPRRITRNARGSARYGGCPRGNRHRGSMSRISWKNWTGGVIISSYLRK
jgi:hypothetical protein